MTLAVDSFQRNNARMHPRELRALRNEFAMNVHGSTTREEEDEFLDFDPNADVHESFDLDEVEFVQQYVLGDD